MISPHEPPISTRARSPEERESYHYFSYGRGLNVLIERDVGRCHRLTRERPFSWRSTTLGHTQKTTISVYPRARVCVCVRHNIIYTIQFFFFFEIKTTVAREERLSRRRRCPGYYFVIKFKSYDSRGRHTHDSKRFCRSFKLRSCLTPC